MRGSLGFAGLLIVNPILILFYQNCSMLPENARAEYHKPVSALYSESRSPAVAHDFKNERACSSGNAAGQKCTVKE